MNVAIYANLYLSDCKWTCAICYAMYKAWSFLNSSYQFSCYIFQPMDVSNMV